MFLKYHWNYRVLCLHPPIKIIKYLYQTTTFLIVLDITQLFSTWTETMIMFRTDNRSKDNGAERFSIFRLVLFLKNGHMGNRPWNYVVDSAAEHFLRCFFQGNHRTRREQPSAPLKLWDVSRNSESFTLLLKYRNPVVWRSADQHFIMTSLWCFILTRYVIRVLEMRGGIKRPGFCKVDVTLLEYGTKGQYGWWHQKNDIRQMRVIIQMMFNSRFLIKRWQYNVMISD